MSCSAPPRGGNLEVDVSPSAVSQGNVKGAPGEQDAAALQQALLISKEGNCFSSRFRLLNGGLTFLSILDLACNLFLTGRGLGPTKEAGGTGTCTFWTVLEWPSLVVRGPGKLAPPQEKIHLN